MTKTHSVRTALQKQTNHFSYKNLIFHQIDLLFMQEANFLLLMLLLSDRMCSYALSIES